MAKLQLGKAPTSFKRTITIEQLDGSKASIELDFKYRTRTQYAELLDSILVTDEKKSKKADEQKSFAEILKMQGDGTIDFMLQIANGWDLEDEFNRANVTILVDTFPNATTEINEAYRVAILEGRLKN
jgi:Phage tail assembly chaperone